MPFHCAYNFKQLWSKTSGWQFALWNNAADLGAARTQVLAFASTLINVIGNNVVCGQCRISDPNAKRVALTVDIPQGTAHNLSPTGGKEILSTSSITPEIALKVQVYDNNFQYKATYPFRGIPSMYIGSGGYFRGADDLLRAFMTGLKNPQYGWVLYCKKVDRPEYQVTGITVAGVVTLANGQALDTTGARRANGNPLVHFNRVHIGQKRRVFQVVNNQGNTFTIVPNPLQGIPTNPVGPSSSVRPEVYTVAAIKNVSIEKTTTHEVGRPNDLSSGHPTTRAS